MSELREKVALTIFRSFGRTDVPWHPVTVKFYAELADVVLAIARPVIIEECAKEAELNRDGPVTKSITAAIRALSEKP